MRQIRHYMNTVDRAEAGIMGKAWPATYSIHAIRAMQGLHRTGSMTALRNEVSSQREWQ